MGAIIAMGVLSAGADGEVDQPDRRQPVLALRSRRPDRRRRLPATYPATSRIRQGLFARTLATTNARLVDQVQIAAAVTAMLCRRSRRTPHGLWPC
jgi:hypothetical protein